MQTVTNGARTILIDSKLDLSFWPEAVRYYTYTWNRICPRNLELTPFELYGGRKPSVRHLKPFGVTVFVGTPKQKRFKLEAKARKGVLVGYAYKTRGYRIWLADENKIVESSNVSFDENSVGGTKHSGAVMGPERCFFFSPSSANQGESVEVDPRIHPGPSDDTRETQTGGEGSTDSEVVPDAVTFDPTPATIPTKREVEWLRKPSSRKTGNRLDIYYYESGKQKRLRSHREVEEYCSKNSINYHPELFNFSTLDSFSGIIPNPFSIIDSDDEEPASTSNLSVEVEVPRTYNQALKSQYCSEWRKAMESEIKIMMERGVWHLEDLPPDATPVGCRWVFATKKDETGKIARFKARLVAQGYKQVKGESYDETFSPVVNFSLIRFFFSVLVSCFNWSHLQCDVTSAYLYAPLNEHIFMKQPPGFVEPGREGMYCKLDRAIYGLHQSGRMWYYEIHEVLMGLGFKKLESCNCVYIFNSNLILLLYVDDIVFFGRKQVDIDRALNLLKNNFDLKVLGRTRRLLGVEFSEDGDCLEIHQTNYILEILDKFKNFKIPVSSLPISKGVIYSKADCPTSQFDIDEMAKLPYRSVLGCISFVASRTRPDISYATNIFSQFQSNPGINHWDGLLKLLGYLRYTSHYRLKLHCKTDQLTVFSDADFASNRDDRTSMGGQLVLMGDAPVDWRTFKEKSISLSTMESEFVALTEASKNLLWFDRVRKECSEFGLFPIKFDAELLVDNQAAIDFVKSPIENYKSKHIDVKLFFVRDLVYRNIFNIKFVRSKHNLADIFTKPLSKYDLLNFINVLFRV